MILRPLLNWCWSKSWPPSSASDATQTQQGEMQSAEEKKDSFHTFLATLQTGIGSLCPGYKSTVKWCVKLVLFRCLTFGQRSKSSETPSPSKSPTHASPTGFSERNTTITTTRVYKYTHWSRGKTAWPWNEWTSDLVFLCFFMRLSSYCW